MSDINKRYINRKIIYSGHVSDVYRAEDQQTHTSVVLKIVDVDINIKPHNIRYELNILNQLNHQCPYVCELLNSYEYMDDLVLVMPEYHISLDKVIKISDPNYVRIVTKFNFLDGSIKSKSIKNIMKEDDIEMFFISVMKGLEFLHSHKIIHRDLKLSNIFFNKSDEGEENYIRKPIIGDFGISYDYNNSNLVKFEDPSQKYLDISTGIFKPPEVCLGITNYDYEVDIWSMGIILTILYSPNFKSILEDDKNEGEGEDEEFGLSDLYLLTKIFTNFGTPIISTDKEKVNQYPELIWNELNNDNYHFKQFQFQIELRKSMDKILPKCCNEKVKQIINKMMYYDRSKRLSAGKVVQLLT